MEIQSSTLQNYLRGLIDKLPVYQQAQLKTLRNCNTKIMVPTHGQSGAFLATNGEKAKFFGLIHCKNPWACPVCTAKEMAGYAEKFAAALDVMKENGYFGFMMTLTVPHLSFMKCKETTDILYNIWKYFNQSRNYCGKGYGNIIRKFFREFEIKHYVSVCEYTWGKNGWHPHFHCIYWIKKGREQEILNWEEKLSEWWLATSKREILKYWNKNNLYLNEEWRKEKLDILFEKVDKKNKGLYISKTDGKINESLSSYYLAGWGANSELAQLTLKNTADGHYTPHQILQMAYDGDKKMEKLYIEFCLQVTTKPYHYRVTWSRTGLLKMALTKLQQKRCQTLIKKKEEKSRWTVLCWFDRQQFGLIRELESQCPILSNILYLAVNHKELLFEFLGGMGIEYHLPLEHFFTTHIENILNSEVA